MGGHFSSSNRTTTASCHALEAPAAVLVGIGQMKLRGKSSWFHRTPKPKELADKQVEALADINQHLRDRIDSARKITSDEDEAKVMCELNLIQLVCASICDSQECVCMKALCLVPLLIQFLEADADSSILVEQLMKAIVPLLISHSSAVMNKAFDVTRLILGIYPNQRESVLSFNSKLVSEEKETSAALQELVDLVTVGAHEDNSGSAHAISPSHLLTNHLGASAYADESEQTTEEKLKQLPGKNSICECMFVCECMCVCEYICVCGCMCEYMYLNYLYTCVCARERVCECICVSMHVYESL
jgi:hypothetical protein